MKHYKNAALFYTIAATAGGIFYREFTRFNSFTAPTALAKLHTHYFMLGMFFFLILLLLEKVFAFSDKRTKRLTTVYHIGLNLTCVMLAVRGVVQVLGTELSKAADASISGIAGIGHLLLGFSLFLIVLQACKKAV